MLSPSWIVLAALMPPAAAMEWARRGLSWKQKHRQDNLLAKRSSGRRTGQSRAHDDEECLRRFAGLTSFISKRIFPLLFNRTR